MKNGRVSIISNVAVTHRRLKMHRFIINFLAIFTRQVNLTVKYLFSIKISGKSNRIRGNMEAGAINRGI